MGKPRDPNYWSKWRAAHPDYRQREIERSRERKRRMTPEERRRDRGTYKPIPFESLPLLFPELQRGKAIAFWDDELRMDLAQEWALAEIEGIDPEEAVAAYRSRETDWSFHTVPISPDGRGQEG